MILVVSIFHHEFIIKGFLSYKVEYDFLPGMMQPLSGADQVWLNAWDIIKDGQERFYIGENFENIFE